MNISQVVAQELNIKSKQVDAVISLLNDGSTVPFIARYRKEATGGLDDTQLRTLNERLIYLTELNTRREAILSSIDDQKKLTPVLRKQIEDAETKARLEDLYLPFKPKRRTKAQIAKEAGLEPLAFSLLNDPNQEPDIIAKKYVSDEHTITSTALALDGARQILMEHFSEDADLLNLLREHTWRHAFIKSEVQKDKQEQGSKFKDYFDYQEQLHKIPSHRVLALFRGQKEGVLRVTTFFETDNQEQFCLAEIAKVFNIEKKQRSADQWLWQCIEWTWKFKLNLKIEVELLCRLREKAEGIAIDVFKENLGHLLMAAPAGKKVTLGLDPGYRTGVKTVVVDDTGKLLEYLVIYPHKPQQAWDEALARLSSLCQKHQVNLIGIGNGTASRETEQLVKALIKSQVGLKLTSVVVSEAGASVYSASELATKEFPDLDVSYRGAVSIARRLQDPLAELVKIDPKSIGVGQYQHDVNQYKLSKSLDAVVEDSVNAVGVDVNTASVPLLKSIAGLNESVAQNIVQFREENGRFSSRDNIKAVPRFGEKTFEQAIGFLRIIDGDNPLDASAVHPESYNIVDKILEKKKISINKLMGNAQVVDSLNIDDFIDDTVGQVTIKDIFEELKKPGRDPRPEFVTATFKEGVETLSDLSVGLMLEGVVTNVTNFGAFIDIGVHQDGLVHKSQLADYYVEDPSKFIKVGQIVSVKVLDIDEKRKRIQLTMKKHNKIQQKKSKKPSNKAKSNFANALSNAFERG